MSVTLLMVDCTVPQLHEAAKILVADAGWQILATSSAAVKHQINQMAWMPEIVLAELDATQPGSVQVIPKLRLALPKAAIVAVVPFAEMNLAMQAMGAGADDFLNKPVAPERLRVTLSNALALRHGADTGALRPVHEKHKPDGMIPVTNDQGKVRALRELENDMIRLALDYHGGSITRAAQSLGIGRSTLYRKMAES